MDNGTVLLLPTYQIIPTTQLLVHIFATLFPSTCFGFDILLFISTVANRRDTAVPVAYITAMCFRGMISNFILALQYSTYLISTSAGYQAFLNVVGRETTLLGTFSYLIALVVSVLMSINRIVVVAKPFNHWFTHTRIFIYCGLIAAALLISLIIPYLSPCYVVFMVNKQSFVSGCAPARHPITTFQNTYAIILPFTCMVVNLSIILHLRFVRNNSYTILWHKIRGNVQANNPSHSTMFSKERSRRDASMIRQTIVIAVYLSIYEFGAFIIKIVPELYTGLPPTGKEAYFYVRMESIPLMNFFIYFVQTKKTRTMVCRFLRSKSKQDSNLVTVSHRSVSGAHGTVVVN